ncbi:MAG: ATP-binding protein [Magnetococcus sp. YQC-5]
MVAFLIGSLLTMTGFFLNAEIQYAPLESIVIFALIVTFLAVTYQLVIKPYQMALARHAEQLEENNLYTKAILDSMANGLLVINPEGTILSVNRSTLKMTGYQETELIGREASTLFLIQGDEKATWYIKDQVKVMIQQDTLTEKEFLLEAKNGSMIPVQVSTSLLRLHEDQRNDIILVINDITERRLAEMRLLRYQDHLQEMVNQRTEKLEQAMQAANAANQAKNEFLANMSHEIRSPMTAIIGMTDLVLHTPLSNDQREKLIIVQNASDTLLSLINEILDLSKIEAGQLFLEKISFDIRATVENVCELLAIKAHEKELELFCYLAPDIPDLVIGDPNRLTQILINLLANAIKFTEKGEVTVLVQRAQFGSLTEQVVDHSDQDLVVNISVADTGIGIALEQQNAIFERFTQSDGSTTRKYGGTGLGLAICKALTELMRGSIRVESEPNEGSVFHVTLRFGLRRTANDVEQTTSRFGSSITRQALVGVRILMADSSSTARTIVAEMLHGFGAIVGEAEDFATLLLNLATARDQNRPWDVILFDQRMLDLGGTNLEGLHQLPGWSGKAVALLPTNQRLAELPVASIFPDMVALIKPIKQFALLRLLKALLEGRPMDLQQENNTVPFFETTNTPLRILLAEDLEENRKLAATILEKVGHTVTQAKDGQEALERIMTGTVFDLILTDLHMPHMDGYELTRRIRESKEAFAQIPIVAVTARALPGEKALCLASGMDAFLVKPYRPMELLHVTSRTALKQRAKHKQIALQEAPPVLKPVEDVSLFHEVSSLYLKGPQLLLEPLKAALDEKNVKRSREQTETIKKMAIALGAERVKLKAVRLGGASRSEEWLKAHKIYKELEQECVLVYDSLMANLPKDVSDPIST